MRITKRSGPRTLPWETPLVTTAKDNLVPFTMTCSDLPLIKDKIHLPRFPAIPAAFNILRRIPLSTLSKALLKSR